MSLEAFGVKNLRCLMDTGLVPIRPITVLVGRNSSGKSTFLRAFPLLRQSVETARNSPILWYHEKYVDFGSLRDAASNRLSEPSVTFQFRVKLFTYSGEEVEREAVDVSMTLAGDEIPYVSRYDIQIRSEVLCLTFDAQGNAQQLTVNDNVVPLDTAFTLGGDAYLLPQRATKVGVNYHAYAGGESLTVIQPATKSVHAQFAAKIVAASDFELAHFMSHVAYLRPLRVSPERAYRIQNLATDEVDPDGKNLPMFLRSLSPAETESFASFTREALGFETAVKATGIHVEILVKERQAKRLVNLVDVGFGYSEVLPLAAVLWANCIRPKMQARTPASLVAIEQPELHLHPAHQAKLARMLVEAVAASGGSKIVVETHSESLINGLGKLIYEGVLKAEDVQIALFDKDDETGETTVRLAGYRDNGALHDWPYGFLSPVAERRVPSAAE